MTKTKIEKLMKISFIAGLVLVIIGVSLATFSNITVSMGVDGVLLVSLIIGLGLLFLIPSKIYLTFVFFQREEKAKQKKKNSL